MPYIIDITDEAAEDRKRLSSREQQIVADAIKVQLTYEPESPTRKRKRLLPNTLDAEWELRIGEFRVFYNVIGNTVEVVAIGRKPGNDLYIKGRKVIL